MTFESCLKKQEEVTKEFSNCVSTEERYDKIIELGRELGRVGDEQRVSAALVHGCQSQMYLASELKDGLLFFAAESDALISAGLAALLLRVYSGETPETLIQCPPDYLEKLGIPGSLTPGRAIGLASLHRTMQQHAIRALSK